jgi:hypothetical protein
MFQEFTHCLLFNKQKMIQILDLLPSSGERVGRHFPGTVYCVLLNMKRGAESWNPVKVPRPETFSSERSVTIRKTHLSKSNGYINTLGKKELWFKENKNNNSKIKTYSLISKVSGS